MSLCASAITRCSAGYELVAPAIVFFGEVLLYVRFLIVRIHRVPLVVSGLAIQEDGVVDRAISPRATVCMGTLPDNLIPEVIGTEDMVKKDF
jgi:hypothetical protein